MTTRPEHEGRNESLLREVNERIAELNQTFEVEGLSEFLCECNREECKEPISISIEEYEKIRGTSTRFFVVPGHEDGSVERIVDRNSRYVVIEKVGDAAEEADGLDPRN